MELLAVIIFAFVGFGLFFFVIKRLLRMAIRVAIMGALLFALLIGAFAWWWYKPLSQTPSSGNRNGAARPARAR